MDNISAISECKPKGNYAVNYANAQTFKGGANVSLDAPVDTFTKQDAKQNKHTALKVVVGAIAGLAALAGVAYFGGITCLAKLKNISWKEARAIVHREAMASTNFIRNYTNPKLLKNVDSVIMYDGKPFTGKTNILGLTLPESIAKSNKGLRIVQNIKNGKIQSVAVLNPHELGNCFIARLSKSGDKLRIQSNLTVNSKETASALENFFTDKLLPEAKKYM